MLKFKGYIMFYLYMTKNSTITFLIKITKILPTFYGGKILRVAMKMSFRL